MLEAGTNSFTLSPTMWIEATGAIGIKTAAGRNGGIFAHKDRIHTDAIAQNIISQSISAAHAASIYACEADVLNDALFGMTAKQWRDNNNGKAGNVRNHEAVEQLVVLSNLESINAELIRQGLNQPARLTALNQTAIHQMQSLLGAPSLKKRDSN